MTEKPDYVRNFPKPPNTEIKHIKNGWYLYEKRSQYDPSIKRTRKISGHMLGTIKPDGFTEKANRDKKRHLFTCKNCGYQSNDDRIGAMNLYRMGINYLVPDTVAGE